MYFNKSLKKDVKQLIEKYAASPSTELEEQIILKVEKYVFNAIPGPHITNPREDDLQEVRIGVLEALRTFDPSKGEFLTWVIYPVRKRLYKATTRDIISIPKEVRETTMRLSKTPDGEDTGMSEVRLERARKAMSIKPVSLEDDFNEEVDSPESLQDLETGIDLRAALRSLSPLHRKVMELLFIRQRHEKSAAAELKISVEKLTRLKEEALSMLKERLEDEE